MPILPWQCAHGDAPPIRLRCEQMVCLAPHDNSVDTNLVIITGAGMIDSFGDGPLITKRVIFGRGVRLNHNPPRLSLLTEEDRVINAVAIGIYSCDGEGNWSEIAFTATGPDEVSRRVGSLEQRIAELERLLNDAFQGCDGKL